MSPAGRPRIVLSLSDSEILDRYVKGATEAALARELNSASSTVHRRLESAGAIFRTAVEATALRTRKNICLTSSLIKTIDGMLLGDAWLEVNGNSEGRLCISQSPAHIGWLDLIDKEFEYNGIALTRSLRAPRVSKIGNKIVRGKGEVLLRTKKYVQFTQQRLRWYPRGEKRVPEDVNLAPKSLAHWYCGDGSTVNNGYGLVFYTDGFIKKDVEFLKKRLLDLYGWKLKMRARRQNQYILTLYTKESRLEFVSLVQPFFPECFFYKLRVKE
jgi:hypothetical protein